MDEGPSAPTPPSAGKALIMLPILMTAVAGYIAICKALGIAEEFAGIFFLLYWALIKNADPREFAPTLFGALGGLIPAYLLSVVPAAYGAVGLAAVILLVLVAIYVQIRELLPLVINTPFMVFMTVGTIPPVAKESDFAGLALSVLISAGYFGGLLFLVNRISRGRAAAVEPA